MLRTLSLIIGSGGLVAGLVAFFKLRSDTAKTTVEAAGGAVIVQAGVITSLREEIARLTEERDEARGALAAIDERKTARGDSE